VFALVSVNGASAACATHGDAPTVEALANYYALVARSVADAGGHIIKVMGDGVLITFPIEQARAARAALESLQSEASRPWSAFDSRCHVVVKLGAGPLMRGRFGPPGHEREDVYGHALNELFKAAPGEFVVLPGFEALPH
jgi:class 3 adenylate cyclase